MIDMRVCLLYGELFGGASAVDQKQPFQLSGFAESSNSRDLCTS
jgi:hypothetical protein